MKLNIRGVEFRYDSSPVLKGVSMEVEKGEILSLIGPNGSGKSTLLRCINRIIDPQKGAVFIDGENISSLGRREIAKLIGYVPQASSQSFPTTVFDTVLMGRRPHISWTPSGHDFEVVSEVLNLLGINEFALRDINELSGGERQKVIIARAVAQEAEVLLLDEPTSHLDLRHQLEVLELIGKLAKQRGITVILALHDLNLAARYSSKIIMLKEGRVHAIGTPEEVITKENIKRVYGVKSEIIRGAGCWSIVPLCSYTEGDSENSIENIP